jgi:predicted ATPase
MEPGTQLGHYRVLGPLGAGGMGEVYRARDTRLGREVAIKLLDTKNHAGDEAVDRFITEARAASNLNHPNIVTIHGIGESPAHGRYIVMELVVGRTLRAVAAEHPALAVLTDIMRQVTQGLAAAHAAGIVHRDLKPENIMVRDDGYVKLVDFGLARRTIATEETGELALTSTKGMLLGTVRYMSPEQTRGDTITPASDVFSCGVVLYELATGQHPFTADSQIGVLYAVAKEAPLAPSTLNPAIPDRLERLIQQMLAKDPAARPSSAEAEWQLADVTRDMSAQAVRVPAQRARRHTVGRASEREALRAALDMAAAGDGRLVCVSGEPGLGKTTLVEDFLTEATSGPAACLVGRGRCSESLAGAEAYLPVLEALEGLVRAGGDPVHRAMKVLAPTWFVQVAPLAASADSSAERVADQARQASQERVKREARAFLQEVSRTRPVVLFIDDIHWADPATVDLLGYIARSFDGMRLLVIATYRVSELLLAGHPFAALKLELQGRGVATELPLQFLDRVDIERYLALEFADHCFPAAFTELIHSKTEGSPLFMVDVLAYLRDRAIIQRREDGWALAEDVPAIERQLPESIRSMIERKVQQLTEDERWLLRVASIQGYRFDAVVAAEAAGLEVTDVEDRLQVLDRVHSFVRLTAERELPDGVLTLRYQFVHVLYQNAFHASLTPARKVALSVAMARSLQRHHARQMGPAASRIALLFEQGRDFAEAARTFCAASQHAANLFAPKEAAALARRGLAALEHLPESPERADLELQLLVMIGIALLVTEGYASEGAKQSYTRAREICQQFGERQELFPILWGLWGYYLSIGRGEVSWDIATQLRTMAASGRAADRVRAAWALGTSAVFAGRPLEGIALLDEGLAHYDQDDDRRDRYLYGHDAGVTCRVFGAWGRCLIGRPDEALQQVDVACREAAALAHPQSLAFTYMFAGVVHQFRGDPERALARAEEAFQISDREGLPQFREWNRCMVGWAMHASGQTDEGIERAAQALDTMRAIGSLVAQPYYGGLLADMLLRSHQLDRALELSQEMIALVQRTGERVQLPELMRIKAAALAALGRPADALPIAREAVAVAERQQSVLQELRCLLLLTRLQRGTPALDDVMRDLYSALMQIQGGLSTRDVIEGRTVLDMV